MRWWLLLLLFAGGAYGAVVPASGSVEVAFTPWDDAEGLVLRSVREARRSVLVQAYVLTSRNIVAALQEAHARSVDVRVLADREMTEQGDNSLVPQLAAAGVPVRLETRYAAAHNKVIVIDAEGDGPVVLTGSYNFSWSAQARNAENLLALRGDGVLARLYRSNWQRHWDEAEPFADSTATKSGSAVIRRSGRKGAGVVDSPCRYLSPQERALLAGDCRTH